MKRRPCNRAFIWISVILLVSSGCDRQKSDISSDYPIQPVPFNQVDIDDSFWAERLEINHKITIPIAFEKAEETGRIDNFRIAGGIKAGKFASSYPFDDSDVYKNIEAACYSLQIYSDPGLEAYLDTLIGFIAVAQEEDGYLYTNRTIDPENTHEMAGSERWVNEEAGSHELYNAGHLYEAAVAHYQATGKRTLLDVALKNADLVDILFGWGKIEKAPGHQEIEIGLVKLYRVTGEKKYLDLARFFLEVRGPGKDSYNQMHKKVLEQDSAVGHAVRAQYMYAAMADIAALTDDIRYLDAIDRLWNDVVTSKTYITGGIGAVREIEGFGGPYHLPNMEAYCETCASIANALWNYRMFLLHGDSKYFDIFEKVLYNGLLSGVSLSGYHFFYPNPLASQGQYSRKAWFGCACCPVNITRFLPSVPGYIYAVADDKLYLNLFIGNEADIRIREQNVKISISTDYPWSGEVKFRYITQDPATFELMIRLPGWAMNKAFVTDLYCFTDSVKLQPELYLNGNKADWQRSGGYASVKRTWNNGDELIVKLPMMPAKVKADKRVSANDCKVALQCGPVIYCLEASDQETGDLNQLFLDKDTFIDFEYQERVLKGIGTLTGKIWCSIENKPVEFTAIPYYCWANREPTPMIVWINEIDLKNCQNPE